jgi:hypothetical protein
MTIAPYRRAPRELGQSVDISGALNAASQGISQGLNIYRQRQKDEEAKQEKAKADYLKQAEVDPIFSVSNYWQQEQAKKIQEFHDDLADIYYNAKNKPSLNDLMNIQTKKQALAMWQGKILQGNQQYQQVVKEIQSDPYGQKYDTQHANKRVADWINGDTNGDFPSDVLLPPRVGDLRGYYESLNWTGDELKTKTLANGRVTEEITPLSEEGLKARVKNNLFNPKTPGLLRTVTEDFAALPVEEKKKWLTEYGDDAIAEWDYQNHGKYAFKQRKTVSPYLGRERSGAGNTQYLPNSLNELNPNEYRTVDTGKVEAKVQKFGTISFAKDINNRRFSARPYYDLSTGDYIKNVKGDVGISDAGVEYLPVKNGVLVPNESYREGNELSEGVEIKPFVVGFIKDPVRGEQISVAYPYTKEWKDFIDANSKQKYNIEDSRTYKFKSKENLNKVTPNSTVYNINGKEYSHKQLLEKRYTEKQINQFKKEGKIKIK